MQIGVELAADRLDLLHALGMERIEQLLVDQLDPLADRLDVVGLAHRHQRAVDVVHHAEQRLDHILAAQSDQPLFLLVRPLTVVVELGHQTQVFVLPLPLDVRKGAVPRTLRSGSFGRFVSLGRVVF